jgi:predicted Rossmann fold flavoprotein
LSQVDVLIIGAGGAGLMCAQVAGHRGRKVVVLEHANKPGKKILMSGGGRCNFTNVHSTPANFLSRNPHFCKSALARYQPADFIAMVERHGIAHHEKELGQLFCNDSSKQIVQMLLDECADAGVEINLDRKILGISRDENGYIVDTSFGRLRAPAVVIATGGLSIPRMGATGFGYEVARQFGHTIVPTRAGLVPLTFFGRDLQAFQDLSGVSLPIEARCNGVSFSNFMLFTHRGVSGPSILQISSYWQPGDDLRANLLPGERKLDTSRRDVELKTILSEVLPRRFALRLCETVFENRPLRQFTPAQLKSITDLLENWPIPATGTEGYATAEVTLGGIDTDGLSSTTMESKLAPGLYFIGEVVDVTGHLGGHNFQWAWASGTAAGQAV